MNPQTQHVFAILKAAYPDKQWHLYAYTAQESVRHAVHFSENGMAVHDPMASDCGRFGKEDRYGLSEEHARLMRRHNRDYARIELGAEPVLGVVFEAIKSAMDARSEGDIATLLDDFGFDAWHTGGGCMAYALFDSAGRHLMVTDDEGSALPTSLRESMLGQYDGEGAQIRLHTVSNPTSPSPF